MTYQAKCREIFTPRVHGLKVDFESGITESKCSGWQYPFKFNIWNSRLFIYRCQSAIDL